MSSCPTPPPSIPSRTSSPPLTRPERLPTQHARAACVTRCTRAVMRGGARVAPRAATCAAGRGHRESPPRPSVSRARYLPWGSMLRECGGAMRAPRRDGMRRGRGAQLSWGSTHAPRKPSSRTTSVGLDSGPRATDSSQGSALDLSFPSSSDSCQKSVRRQAPRIEAAGSPGARPL